MQGHETGCYSLLHETLGDPLFPLPNNWPVCDFELEGRIKEATRVVEEISGEKMASFRCPGLWGSNKAVNVLESLGYGHVILNASPPQQFRSLSAGSGSGRLGGPQGATLERWNQGSSWRSSAR